MGDLVTLLQQQRIEAGKPAALKAGESLSGFAVANGMGQALNLTPIDGKPLIGQDLARFQLYAEQALRLGLNGDMAQDVATQMRQRGALQPQTSDQLRMQVQKNIGWSDERVAAEIRTLENRANLLPDEVQAAGIMPVLVQTQPPAAGGADAQPPVIPPTGGTNPQSPVIPPAMPLSQPTTVLSGFGPQPSAPLSQPHADLPTAPSLSIPTTLAAPPDEPRPRSGLPVLRPPSTPRKEEEHD